MGLTLVKPDININFVGIRKAAFIASAVLILVGLVSLTMKGGPRYGIDFAGGMMVQLKFDREAELNTLKDALDTMDVSGLVVQRFGLPGDNEYLVRIPTVADLTSNMVREKVTTALSEKLSDYGGAIQRLEMVGPKVGADLRNQALNAMFYAVLLIAIYISGRFEQRWWTAAFMAGALATAMKLLDMAGIATGPMTLAALAITMVLCWKLKLNYALGAVVALVHDVLITVGLFSLMDKEFDLTIVAALLTIIGYSLNDTIIVFDRIRENIRGKISNDFGVTINSSINQTLSRTLLTSGTTLLVVVALYFLGGGVIHDFALALLIGIGVGTYSSIFVASPILLAFAPDMEAEEAKPKKKAAATS
ncbi:MAG: protein translocase subunit SecF [Desulfovibrionaceae bacterium]